MSPAPARSHRLAVPLFLGALLAFLTVGLLCAPASAGPSAVAETVRAAAPSASAVDGDTDTGTGTGCGKDKGERGGHPAAPNRGASAYEQLASTLSYEHSGTGAWTADGHLAGVTPDRGPPPRDPPSPVELSVLRV